MAQNLELSLLMQNITYKNHIRCIIKARITCICARKVNAEAEEDQQVSEANVAHLCGEPSKFIVPDFCNLFAVGL